MANNITVTGSLSILGVSDVDGTTKNNIGCTTSLDAFVATQGEFFTVNGGLSIPIPQAVIYDFYVRNLHATNFCLVLGTMAASAGAPPASMVLANLSPGGFISVFNSVNVVGSSAIATGGVTYVCGFTSLTLLTTSPTPVEYFVGA